MNLCKLRGSLCIGGMSLYHLDVFIEEASLEAPAEWSGEIQIERSEQHLLELDRRYLLMLDEDHMGCVKIVAFRPGSDVGSIAAEFVACSSQ